MSPISLQAKLQRDPQFYCELLCLLYHPDNESAKAVSKPTKQQINMARHADQLLNLWKAIPGADENGVIDESILHKWIKDARSLCSNSGLLPFCDTHIGELLAKEPDEGEVPWPSEPIRDVIDELDSEDLTLGFKIAIFNKRGASWKSLGEGGQQEWLLADKYKAYAKHCESEWPVTATALHQVAERYEAEARSEDEGAKANR